MVDSSIWVDRDQRSIFITALLMAVPVELTHPAPQLQVRNLDPTGWMLPPGRYGFVEAAGTGIVRRDGMADLEAGLRILEELGAPDPDSRSQDFDGRRLIRVDGGYVVLNYFLYRDRDYTAADRQRRHRERKRGVTGSVTRVTRNGVTRNVTHADADAEVEALTPAVAVEEPSRVTPTDVIPMSTDLPTWPSNGTLELTRMLNRGMQDNPAIGNVYNPVIANSGATLQAAEQLQQAGVALDFAELVVYTAATAYKPKKPGDQISSLSYLVPAILDAWQRRNAKTDASTASPPAAAGSPPSATSGHPLPKSSQNGTYTLRAGEIINLIRNYRPPPVPTQPPPEYEEIGGRLQLKGLEPLPTPPPPAWREGLTVAELRAVDAIGVDRIRADDKPGIVLAQLSKAIGEAARG